jgi:hypothetical protein
VPGIFIYFNSNNLAVSIGNVSLYPDSSSYVPWKSLRDSGGEGHENYSKGWEDNQEGFTQEQGARRLNQRSIRYLYPLSQHPNCRESCRREGSKSYKQTLRKATWKITPSHPTPKTQKRM